VRFKEGRKEGRKAVIVTMVRNPRETLTGKN